MAWFGRKSDDDLDPQRLLAQAHEATPLEPVALAAPADTGFRMPVQDVFSIHGRGTVVTGRVEAGTVNDNSTLRLTRVDGTSRDVQVNGIEAFRKRLHSASAGDNIGLLLSQITKTDIGAGDILSG